MKTITPILIIALIVAAYLGGRLHGPLKTPASPQQLTLEQILSIRELHLVKHTYHDLFFLHRKNDPGKPIRALVQVPVTLTAYLNLKEIKVVYKGDTVHKLILPRAELHEPVYQVNHITIRETRGFQLHAGKDLYPIVGNYLGEMIKARMDTARNLAISNRILIQAEAEGKEYMETLLRMIGLNDVSVMFNDESKDKEVDDYLKALHKHELVPTTHPTYTAQLDAIPLGFLPLPR